MMKDFRVKLYIPITYKSTSKLEEIYVRILVFYIWYKPSQLH